VYPNFTETGCTSERVAVRHRTREAGSLTGKMRPVGEEGTTTICCLTWGRRTLMSGEEAETAGTGEDAGTEIEIGETRDGHTTTTATDGGITMTGIIIVVEAVVTMGEGDEERTIAIAEARIGITANGRGREVSALLDPTARDIEDHGETEQTNAHHGFTARKFVCGPPGLISDATLLSYLLTRKKLKMYHHARFSNFGVDSRPGVPLGGQ
jgi:hypothetical protein